MSSPLEFILAKFDEPKRSGAGWIVRCKAHDDHNPSLSISEGDDGRVLLKCFAGCTMKEICIALDVNETDLFVPKPGTPRSENRVPPNGKPAKKPFATPAEAIAVYGHKLGKPSGQWTYVGISTTALHRLLPAGPDFL